MQHVSIKLFILHFFLFFGFWTTQAKRSGKLFIMRNRAVLRKMGVDREDLKPKICYDLVGCFADPPAHLTIKRPPEHPNVIQTRFLLYTRLNRDSPNNLQYGDNMGSIVKSKFDAGKPLKIIIHGYKGSGSDVGAILLMQALLDVEDVNVLMLDWTRGAATTYQTAVANTELVGRQLSLVLLDVINLGTQSKNIHIIGFSLGAHIAGCASEALKKKNFLLGRITGLDPASPFFRNHLFREKTRKLDATDAELVDVIHTDGSEDFADGFGLLKPLGHIDFFPNGGREQPGCTDIKNSVVVSHLKEEALTKEVACSHLRAWTLFLESVRMENQSCKFTAWPCPQGRTFYTNGMCFPSESTFWSQEMGYRANRGPLGVYYLPTRGAEPFCGQPLRASVTITEHTPRTTGTLFLRINQRNSMTTFKLQCVLSNRKENRIFYDIVAAEFQPLFTNQSMIKGHLWYQSLVNQADGNTVKNQSLDTLLIDRLAIEDRKGNRWEYCIPHTAVSSQDRMVILQREQCTSL
ncbi:pancreatic triacylglycerol lipase [Calliopsis andreniformis]|uniref:pancreatic triacylglycerol lipase n=1 Tax=Calliopsis andreniformis TaxID=337506 RepID=UPI003FCDE829